MVGPERCCGEYGCRRGQPIRVLRNDLTGAWYVVTQWCVHGDGEDRITAERKHAVHPDDAARLEELHRTYAARGAR